MMTAATSPGAGARILIVDDDAHLREVVGYALRREGHEVREAADGAQALRQLAEATADVLVVDVSMPNVDGFELCRRVRANCSVPILFLSARNDELDRVLGLELGGDDYVTKPFSTRELVSRIKALLRRARATVVPGGSATTELRHGRLAMAPEEHRAWVDEGEVVLTATEFRLLATLLRRPGRVFSRGELARAAYPDVRRISDRTVDSHVRRVRAKLREHGLDPIETVHGVGYRLGETT